MNAKSGTDQSIQCPCYPICSALGVETGQWCQYRESDLPPPGLHTFDPKDTWCPPGVQANVMMLGHLLAQRGDPSGQLQPVLTRVRRWARELRAEPITYQPVRLDCKPSGGE